MDDARAIHRMQSTLATYYAALCPATPDGSVIERNRVTAGLMPAAPERSVCNATTYADAHALLAMVPELDAAYLAAGVAAWTVWVNPGDATAAAGLAAAGHVLDGEPMGMILEDLDGLEAAQEQPPEFERAPRPRDVAAVLGPAYGFDEGTATLLATLPAGVEGYLVRHDGTPACVLATLAHNGDAGVFFVGTIPEARGRGYARELLRIALQDARERGCETSTLQATKAGHPVYLRLGYRDIGAVQMWERRRPSSGAA